MSMCQYAILPVWHDASRPLCHTNVIMLTCKHVIILQGQNIIMARKCHCPIFYYINMSMCHSICHRVKHYCQYASTAICYYDNVISLRQNVIAMTTMSIYHDTVNMPICQKVNMPICQYVTYWHMVSMFDIIMPMAHAIKPKPLSHDANRTS